MVVVEEIRGGRGVWAVWRGRDEGVSERGTGEAEERARGGKMG
jgi:hypothetical protein